MFNFASKLKLIAAHVECVHGMQYLLLITSFLTGQIRREPTSNILTV